MKRVLRSLRSLLAAFGFDLLQTVQSLRGVLPFVLDFKALRNQRKSSKQKFPFGKFYPCLHDRYEQSGIAKGHYFHQDLLVARRVFQNNPEVHLDVGSRVDGFVAHVAAFRKIKVIDIRPLPNTLSGIEFIQADMMKEISEEMVDHCDSLSCLHTLEHFGLGRYGDPINYDGYRIGLDNLHRMLKKNGMMYFSVPIGAQRIEFNAHRVFSLSFLLQLFEGRYQIDGFSYVDDQGDLYEDAELEGSALADNFGCRFGCGIFEMTKL